MLPRSLRVLVFLALAALLANARCLDNCGAPAKSDAPQCPLHKAPVQKSVDCSHLNPQFATAPDTTPALALPPATHHEFRLPEQTLQTGFTAPQPPDSPPQRQPVLRI